MAALKAPVVIFSFLQLTLVNSKYFESANLVAHEWRSIFLFVTTFPLFSAGGPRPQLRLTAGGRSLCSELWAAQIHRHRSADPVPSPLTHSAQSITALGPLHHALRLLHHPNLTLPLNQPISTQLVQTNDSQGDDINAFKKLNEHSGAFSHEKKNISIPGILCF